MRNFLFLLSSSIFLFLLLQGCHRKDNLIKSYDLEVAETEISLNVGENHSLNVSVTPDSEKKDVKYLSGNEAIATVSSEGVVTAISEGKTEIKVSFRDIVKSVRVIVKNISVSSKLKIALLTGYNQETEEVVFEEIPNNVYSTTILDYKYFVAVYDNKYVKTKEGWNLDDPTLASGESDDYVKGFSVQMGPKAGITNLTLEYKGEKTSIRITMKDSDEVFKELYKPFVDLGANIDQVKDWENKNYGTLVKTTPGKDGDEKPYKLYSFNVQDPNQPQIMNRAYIIYDEEAVIYQAFIVLKPITKVYDIQGDYDYGYQYNVKEMFLGLLSFSKVQGLSIDTSGSGFIKGILGKKGDEVVYGIKIYPNKLDLDENDKSQSVVFDYRPLKVKESSSFKSMNYLDLVL